MKHSFLLVWRALVRGRVLFLLLAAVALAHLLLPALVRSDGTAAGGREMYVRAVTGATYVLTVAVVLACACGAFAQERAHARLPLAMVRPASAFGVACGAWLALCALAAAALALTAALTWARLPETPPCRHRHVPALPPAAEAAHGQLAAYLADARTPEAVRKAPRAAVLRLLANKERERYDVVRPGAREAWPFPEALADATGLVVRVRFATPFDLRTPLAGVFTLGACAAVVSNCTQSVVEAGLARRGTGGAAAGAQRGALAFENTGGEVVMLRPRRDLEILAPADAYAANLARAVLQMLSLAALLAAFGLFLSAALSRPVALFTAFVSLAVALMAPSVVLQYPDALEASLADRAGLAVARALSFLAAPAEEAAPLAHLATDVCIEWGALARSVLVNAVALPLALLALAAACARRRPLENLS